MSGRQSDACFRASIIVICTAALTFGVVAGGLPPWFELLDGFVVGMLVAAAMRE